MHELKVTMLGPSGVGKTTLLTAMYDQFANNIGEIDLQLTPDEESSATLQERLIELKTLLDEFEAKGGVKATEGEPNQLRSFRFGLGRRGKKPSLQLHFQDYPGGYHLAKASPERRQFVKTLLTECVAVVITIDAPALMEKQGKWNEKFNRPQQMTDLFKTAYQNLDSPRLVIFAPIRCEKYLKSGASLDLVQRIKEEYKGLFDFLTSKEVESNVAIVITPVQTVGSVVFSRIEMNDGEPQFKFRKTGHDAKYSPEDSEQPLRYLLRFLLKLHLNNRRFFLRDWFSRDTHLVEAIRKLSKGCKTSGGFAVIQGNSYLNL